MKRKLMAILIASSMILSIVPEFAASAANEVQPYNITSELEMKENQNDTELDYLKILEDGETPEENLPTPNPNMNTEVQVIQGEIPDAGIAGKTIEISNKEDLKAMRDRVNAGEFENITYLLTADIDLTGENWTPIGTYINEEARPFLGTFDGQGHKITFSLENKDNENADNDQGLGLFGYNSGTIKNLAVDAEMKCKGSFIGGLVGYNAGGAIEMCYTTGHVYTYPGMCVGGMAGMNHGGSITNCYNMAYAGDWSNFGATKTCSFYVGGIAGYLAEDGFIDRCYSNYRKEYGDAHDCEHNVFGYRYVGGIAGYVEDDAILNKNTCFFLRGTVVEDIYHEDYDNDYATPLLVEQMSDKSIYEAAGWDFENIWGMLDYYERWVRPVFKQFPEPKKWTRLEGGGTEEDPYIIFDLADLENLRNYIDNTYEVDKYYILTNDIDLSEKYGENKGEDGDRRSWIPIGSGYRTQFTDSVTFKGVFDGNGHTIKNFYIDHYGYHYDGLFFNSEGTVKNLTLTGTYKGSNGFGIVGYNHKDGIVENCTSDVQCVGGTNGYYAVGGIVGFNEGVVRDCLSKGDITHSGIAGYIM